MELREAMPSPMTNLEGACKLGERIWKSLAQGGLRASTLYPGKGAVIYHCERRDGAIYIVESGQVKLLGLSRGGRECIVEICAPGDIFGDSCLAEALPEEMAVTMTDAVLRRLPATLFLSHLSRAGLLEGYIKYSAARLAEQRRVVTDFATASSEYRLGATLLRVGRKIGEQGAGSLRLAQRISHQELAEMVGTTRPRISEFMTRFRTLGLLETTPEFHLVIKELCMTEYLTGLEY